MEGFNMTNNKTIDNDMFDLLVKTLKTFMPLIDLSEIIMFSKKALLKKDKGNLIKTLQNLLKEQAEIGKTWISTQQIKEVQDKIEFIDRLLLSIAKTEERRKYYEEEYQNHFKAMIELVMYYLRQNELRYIQEVELQRADLLLLEAMALLTTADKLLVENRNIRAMIDALPLKEELKKPILNILDTQETRLQDQKALAEKYVGNGAALVKIETQESKLTQEQQDKLADLKKRLQDNQSKLKEVQQRESLIIEKIKEFRSEAEKTSKLEEAFMSWGMPEVLEQSKQEGDKLQSESKGLLSEEEQLTKDIKKLEEEVNKLSNDKSLLYTPVKPKKTPGTRDGDDDAPQPLSPEGSGKKPTP